MIISEMNERYNIDENETKEILKTLRDKGMIYKDRDGGFELYKKEVKNGL